MSPALCGVFLFYNWSVYALPNKLKNLEELRSFLREYFKDRKVKVYLFGSRARKDNRVFSDVDLAFESSEDLSKDLTYLSELLEESWLPYKVDLVELSKVNEDFRETILKEAVLWVG